MELSAMVLIQHLVLSYACDPDHAFIGDSQRTCEFNSETRQSKWSGSEPSCAKKNVIY